MAGILTAAWGMPEGSPVVIASMSSLSTSTPVSDLTEAMLDTLFHSAHTVHSFSDEPVSVAAVREVYEAMRFAPTAMNSQPLRLAVVSSAAARERLVAHLRPGNQAKTLAAPLTVVTAYDPAFHNHMPRLAPEREGLREKLAPDADFRESKARFNGLLQVGYFILGLRATGLHVGPMTGFDAAGVDGEFFVESGWRSLVVMNIGHGPSREDGATRPRAPRLDFADAATVL